MISRRKFDTIFWWVLFILACALLVGINANLEAQDIGDPLMSYSYFTNGIEIYISEEPIIFIYGNQMFGFKNGGFQAVISTGDTLEIIIKRKEK